MRRNYQGGSLAGFIIIAVLLGLVLVGGLYGLNRYNAQKAADETAKTDEADKKTAADEASQTKTDENKSANDTTPTPGDVQTRTDDSTDTSTSTPTSSASSNGSEQLPQTGPTDSLFMLLAATLLTFAGTHYLRSRQVR